MSVTDAPLLRQTPFCDIFRSVKRAAIYCRISRDRVGAGLGVQRQEEDCRALVLQLGWDVVVVYTDNDLSAYSGKPRPGYRLLLADIEAGVVDVVVTWHTDRLHRSPVELEEYIGASERRSISTHTVKAGPLDLATPSGRLVARQLGAVARYEVEHSVERQQRAKLQAATEGRWKGGRRPYGYEPDGTTIREDEAAIVRDATDAVLAGDSLRGLAAGLRERGATTSTGRHWDATQLRGVLLRPRNAGLMEHQGKVIGQAEWPALVDETRWRALVSVLADPARRTSFSTGRRWMLSGAATCGVCGGAIYCTQVNSAGHSVPSYTCRVTKHIVRNAVELDALISRVVIRRLSRPDAVDLLDVGEPDSAAKRLREADDLRELLDGLALAYAGRQIDARQLAAGSDRLRAQLDALEAEIAAAGRGTVFDGLDPGRPGIDERWGTLSVARRRAVVQALLDVVIHKSARGRRKGWRAGESYFDASTIETRWKA